MAADFEGGILVGEDFDVVNLDFAGGNFKIFVLTS